MKIILLILVFMIFMCFFIFHKGHSTPIKERVIDGTVKDNFVLEAFQKGILIPESGYNNWFVGCCDPANKVYLVFEYPLPPRPENLLPHEEWPSCYEIRYTLNGPEDPTLISESMFNPDGTEIKIPPSFWPKRTIFYPGTGQFSGYKHGDGYSTKLNYQKFLKTLESKK